VVVGVAVVIAAWDTVDSVLKLQRAPTDPAVVLAHHGRPRWVIVA
jgi:hypothetical protein